MDRCLNCMKETASDVCPHCGYDRSAYELQPGALRPQTRLKGRYMIGRVLGRGGFGITYNGWDAQNGRRVAVKEYFPSGLAVRTEDHNTISAVSSANTHAYKSGVVKFFDEAQILSEFGDVKEIVEIYDFFYENETSYIVMEYIEGENILQVVAGRKRMDTAAAVDIILKLTGAMIKVHERDVLHRDISPSNILVTNDGGIKLIDFGSARQFAADQSNSMSVILKNGFAPIEQYSRKGNHGPWTDIYSICATFYYMITGKLPEQATDRLIEDALIPPSKLGADITPKQEAVLLKGLAVKAKDRYQSAPELKSAIEKAFGNHPATARPVPTEEQKTVALEDAPVPVQKEKKGSYVPVILTTVIIAIIILTMLSLTIWRKPADEIKQTDTGTTVAEETDVQTEEIESTVKQAETEKIVVTETETTKTEPVETEPKIISVTGITLSKTTLTLEKGGTGTLAVTVNPANAPDKTVTWTTSDPIVASVDEGKVTARAAGTAVITAKASNGKTSTCTVKVTVVAVERINIEKTSVTLNSGETTTLAVTVSPGNAEDKTVTLISSDPNVAAVKGLTITGKNAGTAKITVKSTNGKTNTCTVTVNAIQATGISLNKPSLSLASGETATLIETIVPSNTTDKNITWLSDNKSVAAVTGGKVKAVSAGNTVITAKTSNGKTAVCTVTVKASVKVIEVSAINISQSTMTLNSGDTAMLTAMVSPDNATNKNVTWISNNIGVATVTGGKVTAISAGTAIITAKTSNGKTAVCTVTIKSSVVYAESVSINTTVYEFLEGDVFNLTAVIYPSNTADKTVTWTSSSNNVATVTDGKVTAISAGTAVITAKTSNGKIALCTVTVKSSIIYAESVSFDYSSVGITEGDTQNLTATVYPSDTTDKTLTWTSSNEGIATVSGGKVTAMLAGTARITVKTANDKTATCIVVVFVKASEKVVEVSSINIEQNSISLDIGETISLSIIILPDNAVDKTITLTSSNPNIAQVNGFSITGTNAGTATITAMSSNGKTDTCIVTINSNQPVYGYFTVDENYNVLDYQGNIVAYYAPNITGSYAAPYVDGSNNPFANNNDNQVAAIISAGGVWNGGVKP